MQEPLRWKLRGGRLPIGAVLAAIVGICCVMASSAIAQECAPFHESFDDAASVAQNGGVVSGTLTYYTGINDLAGDFDGTASVRYTNSVFATQEGSLTFWFRKNSADAQGGILQIGSMGAANSIGFFYRADGSVACEIRNSDGSRRTAASAAGVVSESAWTHIMVIWKLRDDGTTILLYINGQYVKYNLVPGDFDPTDEWMDVGETDSYGPCEGLIDELRMFDHWLLTDELYAEYVYSADRFLRQESTKPVSTGPVQLIAGELYVEGKPFKVKGVGYQPVPIGSIVSTAVLNSVYTHPEIIARDMTLLRDMNVNTIRTWSQVPNTTLLDACYNGGDEPIYVLMGFWVSTDQDFANPTTRASIKSAFATFVDAFKDHPAVLGWGLGNENNYSYSGDVADWYTLANELAEVAYLTEGATYHPSIIVNGGMSELGCVDFASDDASMNYVDVWGMNAYTGEDFYCFFNYFEKLTTKPLLFTEYGVDAYDNRNGVEFQDEQAAWVVAQWRQLSQSSLGGTVMAYSDEWWKDTSPYTHDAGGYSSRMQPDGYSNEEWWGMVAVQDNGTQSDIMLPRQVYYELAAEFGRLPGDLDCSERVDGRDIAGFVQAIVNPAAYQAAYPGCDVLNADMTGDYVADEFDIEPFIDALLSQE